MMVAMRLTANVRQVTGSTRHRVAQDGGLSSELQPAVRLEIQEDAGGFLLLRYARSGFVGDTWHALADEAKQQALVEFSVQPEDWKPLETGSG
jgi:hypothetical protein